MTDTPTFVMDGKSIPYHDGDTIMDAALRAGVYIPHLCHNPEFTPHGSCRVCIVEVNGRYVSACTMPASSDMKVSNRNDEVMHKRRRLLQMLFVEGNHVCPACEKSGNCQLQAVAYFTEMLEPHFTHFFPKRSVDASHADIAIDHNRCILCELCVRASRDQDGKNIFSISGRGIDARLVVNSVSGKLVDTDITKDDSAVQVCPVGAILPKHHGYDRPIGERVYDKQAIDVIGDIAQYKDEDVGA